MFVDLMHDLANTFTERFLKAQLVFEQPIVQEAPVAVEPPRNAVPTKRYNALGILEDVVPEEVKDESSDDDADEETEAAPAKTRSSTGATVIGAGAIKSLGTSSNPLPPGWESTPRNNACPCGSGKKFKKCHGANL